jgi:CubicO group peptidase (beta-lactamase class C family)
MEQDSERARAVLEALDGAFPGDGIVVAVAAVGSGSSGPAFAVTEGLPEDARFEIGSITKTMTAALLASLVGDGVLTLDDEIGRWLDAGPNGNITLEQLATHTSGLPRLAPNQPTGEAIGGWVRLDHHRRAALPQRRNRRVLGVHDDRPGRRARHGRAGEHAWQVGRTA